jgi:hypothetical protein
MTKRSRPLTAKEQLAQIARESAERFERPKGKSPCNMPEEDAKARQRRARKMAYLRHHRKGTSSVDYLRENEV